MSVGCFSGFCKFKLGRRKHSELTFDEIWLAGEKPPAYTSKDIFRPEVLRTIETRLDEMNSELRELSLRIHDNPELAFEERLTHDTLTGFMEKYGFKVSRHYLGLETAWRAEFTHGIGGRVIGVNSEMDALPGIGHACGHNLIAIAGVGVAIAIKYALETHNVSGKVVLLGTPAEESGSGKILLLKDGAYKEMDACIMCHPGTGPSHSAGSTSTLALQPIFVEYFGHTAHAGVAPWEGTNALDAAFVAYSSIGVLRQQIKPTSRVHGTVEGRNWAVNVIPDYAKMTWYVRAPTKVEMTSLAQRIKACLEAAALATGCRAVIEMGRAIYDVRQNSTLSDDFNDIISQRYGLNAVFLDSNASTDFGNVSYELPGFHPGFAIPTQPNGGNHTPAFADAARTEEAHKACITVSKALALVGFRVLDDQSFCDKVKKTFLESLAEL